SLRGKLLGTVPAPSIYLPRGLSADRCRIVPREPLPVRFRPQIPDSPLTQAVPLPAVSLSAAGIPVTAGVRLLDATGVIILNNAPGFACLTLRTTNAAGWPSLIGVVVAKNLANPAHFDLSVVYNPAGGAAGIRKQIALEQLPDLSLDPADTNYVVLRINS